MAESAHVREFAIRELTASDSPRHSAFIRITHAITALSFLGLLVSGIAILLAHPRFYWGETGSVGAPSLFDLPIPFMRGHSGWGRYLHFLCAWFCVLTGLLYFLHGLLTQHFRNALLPAKTDLSLKNIAGVISDHLRLKRPSEGEYNILQKVAYLTVVFVVFPAIILTGLAMSPAITSVLPALVRAFGGQQSARTLHFFLAVSLVLFLLVHLAMVCRAGFASARSMITGDHAARRERP